MAAEGYSRVSGRLGVANVTTGPGSTNAITGVYGAWTDSIPLLVVSGQVKRETVMATYPQLRVRQLGRQEADIVSIVKSITKYAVLVSDPSEIRYHLERALWLAENGRPGPVWLDIPTDVQAANIDPAGLRSYDPAEDEARRAPAARPEVCGRVLRMIAEARRPVLLGGGGVRQAGAVEVFRRLAGQLGIPCLTSPGATDLLPDSHPAHCGRTGAENCTRPGNLVLQNADLIVAVGASLGVVQTGYHFAAFAPRAVVVHVDADTGELDKPTFQAHSKIHADARSFLEELDRQAAEVRTAKTAWLAWAKDVVRRYPVVVRPRMEDPARPLNPYVFLEELFAQAGSDDIFAASNGAAFWMSSQAAKLGPNQRYFFNSGCASMGYGLPAAIGAALAGAGRRVICIEGDGSIQMNIQELQTAVHCNLPVKIVVLNNGGYLSMRSTQSNFFGLLVGESPESGVSLPSFVSVAQAYGMPAARIDKHNYRVGIRGALASEGPMLVEAMVDPAQRFEPRVAARRREDGTIYSPGLEDMWPNLPPEELAANMLPWDEEAESASRNLRRLAEAVQSLDPVAVAAPVAGLVAP